MAGFSFSGIVRKIIPGANVTVNNADPANPVVASTGGGGGGGTGGTFTPVLEGDTTPGTGTYTTQRGVYYRVGDLVWFSMTLIWTSHSGTGSMIITGLPFAEANIEFPMLAGCCSDILLGTNRPGFSAQIIRNTATVQPLCYGSNQGFATVAMDGTGTLKISGSYQAAPAP